MKHGQDNLGAKRPRYHPVIAWEQQNLTNDFVDISRVALDNRYGKVGGSLYKRRNGSGPTDGKTPGLFGIVNYESQTSAFFAGASTAIAVYVLSDWYLNKGYQLKGWKRRIARSPMTFGLGILAFYAVTPKN
ncbi:MAG: hypothetical protein VW715_06670 [Rhodospirillales bacterium]